jgi:spermidine/putrescine transport system substrate-binding protein
MPEPTSRRQFLARAAILAATAPTLGSFIAACSKSGQSSSSAPTLTIAAPDHPVKWDIPADNKPIADGLAPEKGATLQVYNYADYLSPDAVRFEEKYNTKVQI